MVGAWLYSADGRALYYVMVPLPMPRSLAYAGLAWDWSADRGRYVIRDGPFSGPCVAQEAPPGHPEATPEQHPKAEA